jgi:hypothetical protein
MVFALSGCAVLFPTPYLTLQSGRSIVNLDENTPVQEVEFTASCHIFFLQADLDDFFVTEEEAEALGAGRFDPTPFTDEIPDGTWADVLFSVVGGVPVGARAFLRPMGRACVAGEVEEVSVTLVLELGTARPGRYEIDVMAEYSQDFIASLPFAFVASLPSLQGFADVSGVEVEIPDDEDDDGYTPPPMGS